MTEKEFRKFKRNLKGSNFRNLAEAAVDFDCRNLDGTNIVGAARDNLIETMSLDYQIGSNYTKNKYLGIGLFSGAVVGLFVKRFIDKRKGES